MRYREATLTYLKVHDQLIFADRLKHAVTCCITWIRAKWAQSEMCISDYALQRVITTK